MVEIKFTTNGANQLIGGFANGDRLLCTPELARHLVDEARCARYVKPPAEQPASPVRARKGKAEGKEPKS